MSIFSIGLSGLSTAQQALYTTSNNITNVYTPGYNREIVMMTESNGNGVRVTDVQRQFNQFVATRLNAASGTLSSLQAYQNELGQIDNLLSDEAAGLAPMMQKFFSTMSQMASSPSDPAAREGVMGAARTMVAQFRSLDQYAEDIGRSVNQQLEAEVELVNTYTQQIADLNREIVLARGFDGKTPNSLANQRDQLVHELSQRIDIRVNENSSGAYSVSLASGLPLVNGESTYQLTARPGASDPTQVMIGYTDPAGNFSELQDRNFQRGTLGGLMEFRRDSLDKLRNQLGQLAYSFATSMNEQHTQGLDLNQQPGADMFSIGSPQVFMNNNNTSTVTAAATITDSAALLATGFNVRTNDDGSFTVTRADNGRDVAATFDVGTNTLSFAGVEMTLSGTPNTNDAFRVEPVKGLASTFSFELNDGAEIAAAQSTGSGDNRNALAMLDLQNQKTIGGTATFNQAYAGMVSTVGNKMSVVKANLAAQEGLTSQLEALQQSESGVNLDEEAANLVRFQQFYQANAKVIETGTTLLDTILSLR
ncbi:MAG TPA: flagellar hook-associated protein FlgK [Pseudidiomarina sp.]|nr:flagellar hook-associated protein FlgK [Pseudidiomarina sp.]